MNFPITRLRRLRQSEAMRSFVRETRLTPEGFIYPLKLGAHRREQVTLSFQIVESAARQLEFQSAESESRTA